MPGFRAYLRFQEFLLGCNMLSRLRLHGLRLLPAPSPYRTTARSEQGGSHSCCSGGTGRCRSGWQPARSKRSRAKNHHADSVQNRTTHLSLACCCLLFHTSSPSTIPVRFRSCRKVCIRLPSLFLLPLILCLSYFRNTTQRHLLCRFLHIHSFLRRVQPIPILPL